MVNRPGRQAPKKKSRGFSNYKPPSAESVKKIAEQKGGRFDSIFQNNFDSWRAKEGENQIRILPPTWDNYEHYAYEVWVHKNVGSDNSTYLCLNKNKSLKTGQPMGKPCPICDAHKKMKADGDADGAKEIQVTNQFVCWIVDRDNKKEFPPALWAMSWTQNRDLASLSYNPRSGKTLVIAHGETGFDIQVKRMGTGIQTKYVLAIDREESPITEDEDVLAELEDHCNEHPVPSTLKFYPAEYLENVISGTVGEDDEDLDEKPKKRRSRDEEEDEDAEVISRSKRSRSRDEEDEDTEDDEEDEEPKNKRGGVARRKLRKPAEEDEDENTEDDNEEGEDEEKPRSRKSSRRSRDEDEEEEEDTEEEEEEDEKPRHKSKPVKRGRSRDEEEEDEEEKPRRGTRR